MLLTSTSFSLKYYYLNSPLSRSLILLGACILLHPFQVIRCFDFDQSQIALSLTKFVEKSSNIFNQDKFIMKYIQLLI